MLFLLTYFLIIIYIIIKSFNIYLKQLSYNKTTFKDIISLITLPFYLNINKINLFIFFINLSILIFFNFNSICSNLLLCLTFFNKIIINIFETIIISISPITATCTPFDHNEITPVTLRQTSHILRENHNEASNLNNNIYKSLLNTKNGNKIILNPSKFGKISYLDNYQWGTTNRFMISVDKTSNQLIQIDLGVSSNICVDDHTKITTERPYLKYLNFFNRGYRNFSNYNLTNQHVYLSFPDLAMFLSKNTSIINNLVIDYLDPKPFSPKNRITKDEMLILFNRLNELHGDILVFLKGPSFILNRNPNLIYDYNKIVSIYCLSNQNMSSLFHILDNPYKNSLNIDLNLTLFRPLTPFYFNITSDFIDSFRLDILESYSNIDN